MKRLLVGLLLLVPVNGFCVSSNIYLSSNTATADSNQNLCKNGSGTFIRGLFHGIRVNNGNTGTVSIYNSSGTATNPIAVVQTSGTYSADYDVSISSGLTYTKVGVADITLLYQCY